jgi:hypothetical protein
MGIPMPGILPNANPRFILVCDAISHEVTPDFSPKCEQTGADKLTLTTANMALGTRH